MTCKEYRIPLPLSVDERLTFPGKYQRGQVYMVSKYTRENSNASEWVEILENKPFENEFGSGQYTYKIIHVDNRIPVWLRAIIPSSALQVHEKSWNAYPYSKTEYNCPFFGDRLKMTIETRYIDDNGGSENVLNLSPEQLKNREIVMVDICKDPKTYKQVEDPKKFSSKKVERGPLAADWMSITSPIMCCYKLCYVEFRYWGFQGKLESYIHSSVLEQIFLEGHRQVFCWLDEWIDLPIEDIRRFEEETRNLIAAQHNPSTEKE